MDFGDTLQTTVDQAAGVAVKVVVFLVILLIGWIVARVIRKVADRLLDKVGLNRLAQRIGIDRWTGPYQLSGLAAKLLYYTVLLITLHIGFAVFGPNPISDMIDSVIAWLPKLFVAVVILVVAAAIAGAVYDVLGAGLNSRTYGRLVARAAQVAIIAVGAIAALNQIEVALTVTTPILVTVLATIGGVLVVGVGGGLIGPMRERWDRILGWAETEGSTPGGKPAGKPAGNPAGNPGDSGGAPGAPGAPGGGTGGGTGPGFAQPGFAQPGFAQPGFSGRDPSSGGTT